MEKTECRTLQAMQHEVDKFLNQFVEGYFPPLAMIARLSEEVGELAREVNHRFGPKPKKPEEAEGSIEEELGDILFVLLSFANSAHIDLEQAYRRVMEKYQTRDAERWTRR